MWIRTCGSAILVMLRKTGLSETDQCTTEHGLGRILSPRPPVDSNGVTSGPAERAPPGPATNMGGAGGRLSSAGAVFGAGNATPNSTAVARHVRPAARGNPTCGAPFRPSSHLKRATARPPVHSERSGPAAWMMLSALPWSGLDRAICSTIQPRDAMGIFHVTLHGKPHAETEMLARIGRAGHSTRVTG